MHLFFCQNVAFGLLELFFIQPFVHCPRLFILCIINALVTGGYLCTNDISVICCRTIKLWSLTGQPLLGMIGHSSPVYSVDGHSSGLIASGGEDCTLKIWRGDVFHIFGTLAFVTLLCSLTLQVKAICRWSLCSKH
jgi:WD40 repeat protein